MAGLGRPRAFALAQKRFNFSTLRCSEGTTKAGAFQRRRGGRESQRLSEVLLLGEGERERPVENVASPQRIDGVDRKRRGLLQLAFFIEPDRASRSARPRQEGGGQF